MRIMNALRTAHQNQLNEYETLIKTAIANRDSSKLQDIRTMNNALTARLNTMIQQLVTMKNNYSAENELQALLADLRQIQRDYNGLIKETDTLETLRRIRQQEDVSIKRELYWYLIVFVFIAILFIGYLIFYGKRAATAPIANTVPSSPNLT
jgi:hypothetical protein